MTLKEQIQEDLKRAIRQRDAERANVLRMVKAAIRDAEIDQQRELDDEGVLAVLGKAARQRRESIEAFQQGRRPDLVAAEERELAIIAGYLPQRMGEAEVRVAVEQAIAELGAKGPGDMGPLMQLLMARLRDRAEGRLINELVREALTRRRG